jgi:hypothetical protein
VKTKRTKAKTQSSKNLDTVHDQAKRDESEQESSDHPTREQLLAWAAEQRRLHREGKLLKEYVKALEAVPGWRWEDPE